MKKADNFDAKQWLVENKITTQSRLNEDESNFKPTKVKGVMVSVDNNDVTFSGKSGDYDGFIEDNGTIYLEVFYPDMEEDEEEIDNDNWKNILGPNHVFVKIANSIPTEVQTASDAVGIRFKASDIIK